MSKITRDEVVMIWDGGGLRIDNFMERINQREEEFAELVEAAVNYELRKNGHDSFVEANALSVATKRFLPPPSLADRLDALAANSAMASCSLRRVLRAIAAEYREKHGGGE